MKRSLTVKSFARLMAVAVVLTFSAIAANAQCETEAVTALYNKFVENHKGTPVQKRTANETGKEYLSKFGECPGEYEKKMADFIRDWQMRYEAALIEFNCTNAVEKTPAQAFELCKPYIAKNPDSLRGQLLLSLAGIRSGDKKKAETVTATRKALELITAGQTVDSWTFGNSKDETVATLEFYSAYLTADTTPAETATMMLKLAKSGTSYSKDPNTFFQLARTLHETEVKKQLNDYKQKCSGPETTPECDAAFTKIEASIDRVIDAYARAVALGTGKPEYASITTSAKSSLTELYKQRHENSDAGLDKLVADVLSKPIP